MEGGGAHELPSLGIAVDNWWLLERKSIFVKGVTPGKSNMLQGVAPCPGVYGQHKLRWEGGGGSGGIRVEYNQNIGNSQGINKVFKRNHNSLPYTTNPKFCFSATCSRPSPFLASPTFFPHVSLDISSSWSFFLTINLGVVQAEIVEGVNQHSYPLVLPPSLHSPLLSFIL